METFEFFLRPFAIVTGLGFGVAIAVFLVIVSAHLGFWFADHGIAKWFPKR